MTDASSFSFDEFKCFTWEVNPDSGCEGETFTITDEEDLEELMSMIVNNVLLLIPIIEKSLVYATDAITIN